MNLIGCLMAATAALSTTDVNVVVMRDAGAPQARLIAVVYSGSAEDPPGKEGIAALTARWIGDDAPLLSVAVGRDLTVFSGAAAPAQLDSLAGALVKALLSPSFDLQALEKVKAAQRAALAGLLDDPDALAGEAFDRLVYRGHPYGHPPAGLVGSIEGLGRDDAVAFHAGQYRKGNLAIGLGGDVSEASVARLRSDLAALPDGEPPRPAREPSFPARPRVFVVQKEGAAPRLLAGHPLTAAPAHPDYDALAVAIGMLGRGIGTPAIVAPPAELPLRTAPFTVRAAPAEAEMAGALQALLGGLCDRAAGSAAPPMEEAKKNVMESHASILSGPPDPLAVPLLDFLFRTPGSAERRRASIDAVSAAGADGAFSRHVHAAHLAVVMVDPDGPALARRLVEARVSLPSCGILISSDDIELANAVDLFR